MDQRMAAINLKASNETMSKLVSLLVKQSVMTWGKNRCKMGSSLYYEESWKQQRVTVDLTSPWFSSFLITRVGVRSD